MYVGSHSIAKEKSNLGPQSNPAIFISPEATRSLNKIVMASVFFLYDETWFLKIRLSNGNNQLYLIYVSRGWMNLLVHILCMYSSVVLTYALLGGAMFYYLERPVELQVILSFIHFSNNIFVITPLFLACVRSFTQK